MLYSTYNNIEYLLELGLEPNIVLKNILQNFRQTYDLNNKNYSSKALNHQQKLGLDLCIKKGADLNKVFDDFIKKNAALLVNNEPLAYIIPEAILVNLVQDYSLKLHLVIKYALINGFDRLLISVINNCNVNDISLKDYIINFWTSDFQLKVIIVEKFSSIYNQDQALEIIRSFGAAADEETYFIEIHSLALEYTSSKNGLISSLSEFEQYALNGYHTIDNIEHYKDTKSTNNFGYTLLHLSLISENYKLATQLVKIGYDLHVKSNSGITPLKLITDVDLEGKLEFIQSVLATIDNVDIDLGKGKTLIDQLIFSGFPVEDVIEKSHDTLFSLFKENADLFSPAKDTNYTSIAISCGNDFYPNSIWATARLMADNHLDIKFYLVTAEMIDKGGEDFLKQFDAVINPGGADSYPTNVEEFGIEDCPLNLSFEKLYQDILAQSYELNIPYLGICAGAQHLSMYHGGKLNPVEGYESHLHQISFIEGTLAYFMALSAEQQIKAISECIFPKISFEGLTFNHFVASIDKLGEGIQLGAISEDNLAMSYAHNNGIRYATQYHAEEHYDSSLGEINHEKLMFDNFLVLAKMHHKYRVNGDIHPIEHFAFIKESLDLCMAGQVDVNGDFL